MTDIFSKDKRSWIMSQVRDKNTSPEIVVRTLIHRLGYRFRLHRSDLPGKPDLVFPSRRKVVFVHGCFWHGHGCDRGNRRPKTNQTYWHKKIQRNIERDKIHKEKLTLLGWQTLAVWECQINNANILQSLLISFLERIE